MGETHWWRKYTLYYSAKLWDSGHSRKTTFMVVSCHDLYFDYDKLKNLNNTFATLFYEWYFAPWIRLSIDLQSSCGNLTYSFECEEFFFEALIRISLSINTTQICKDVLFCAWSNPRRWFWSLQVIWFSIMNITYTPSGVDCWATLEKTVL